MTGKMLFLAWQHPNQHSWYPLGRLDITEADGGGDKYRFRYTHGLKEVEKYQPLNPLHWDFPSSDEDYSSNQLFPIFKNRIMSNKREDFPSYIGRLGLRGNPGVFDILSVSGGRRMTDNFEVFPRLVKNGKDFVDCRFFLDKLRCVDEEIRRKVLALNSGASLGLKVGVEDGEPSARIFDGNQNFIGCAPRYLAEDLCAAEEHLLKTELSVVQVNGEEREGQEILLGLRWQLNGYNPMSAKKYQPIVE